MFRALVGKQSESTTIPLRMVAAYLSTDDMANLKIWDENLDGELDENEFCEAYANLRATESLRESLQGCLFFSLGEG